MFEAENSRMGSPIQRRNYSSHDAFAQHVMGKSVRATPEGSGTGRASKWVTQSWACQDFIGKIMADIQRNPKQQLISELHNFAAVGDKIQLTALLKHFPSLINETAKNGWTALMYAARNGHFETVQVLLEKGCDRAVTNKSNQSALDIAKFWGYKNIANLLTNLMEGQEPVNQLTSEAREHENYFCRTFLDRKSEKRIESKWLNLKQKQPTSVYILFSNLRPLAVSNEGDNSSNYPRVRLLKLCYEDVKEYLEQTETTTVIFLGVELGIESQVKGSILPTLNGNDPDEDEDELVAWFVLMKSQGMVAT
uniref:Uncharacterized protein n=1 Tax=Sphaerodactylus townsendi TaxID=933632 RepID=A0ACB8EQL3_9SAUR